MLQRHKWCFRNRSPLYPRFALGQRHKHQHEYNQRKTQHTVTFNGAASNFRDVSRSKISGSSLISKDVDVAAGDAAKPDITQSIGTLNSWIDPGSLANSLEAHRKANRDATKRDGNVKNLHRRRRKSVKTHLSFGPWVGMKVLHLAPASTVQISRVNQGGACPHLLTEWRPHVSLSAQLRFPWFFGSNSTTKKTQLISATEQLSAEMEACNEYFSPSSIERQAATAVFAEIQSIILPVLDPDSSIDLMGSRASGTDGPLSDLDINLRVPMDQDAPERQLSPKERLSGIKRRLCEERFADRVVVHAYIGNARVPIVTGTHLPSGLEFQIQNTQDARASLEVVKASVAEFPGVNILFKMVKQMLSMRGLTTAIHGGITSYPLLTMIVTSLKLAPPRVLIGGVSSQLLHVLEFWSGFDFEKNEIILMSPMSDHPNMRCNGHAIDPVSAIPKIVRKQRNTDSVPCLLSLEDPADPSNNLGSSARNFKHVQACFIEARNTIQAAMQDWNHGVPRHSPDQEPESLLAWCLGADYTAYEESRLQLRRWYKEVTFSTIDAPT